MKYPNGEVVSAGDLIWWNGGDAIGYVQSMVVSEEELHEWDLDESHLFLANIHPFDPTSVAGIGYPQSHLAEEGIQLLSADEKQQLAAATLEASRLTGIDFSTVPHGIGLEGADSGEREWVFSVIHGDELEESVRVPFQGAV